VTRISVRSRWEAFWFEPSPAIGLAICRVLFFGAFLLYYLRINYTELGNLPPHAWRAVWPFAPLGLGLPSASTLDMLQWVWRVSLFAACIGVMWRMASLVAFVLGLYLIGLSENVARINHSDAIVVFALAVMALSRGADTFSVDALRGRTSKRGPCPSGEYTWPIRAMWLVMATIYFAAGITKLATSGVVWVTSANLANLLMLGPVTSAPLTGLGQEIGRHAVLSSGLAALALMIELSMPLALVSTAARLILVPALFIMQVSIRALMGPGFTEFFICGLFWIPWGRVAERSITAGFRHRESQRWRHAPSRRTEFRERRAAADSDPDPRSRTRRLESSE
jgi:hypothetical protein